MRKQTKKREEKKTMDWWKFTAGLLGVIGVVATVSAAWGDWLVGVAFLALLVGSFFKRC